jgi:hypothetical protein
LFYSIYMIELLLFCGFDTLEYSWLKATIGICMLVDYSMAKKWQQLATTIIIIIIIRPFVPTFSPKTRASANIP